MNNERNGRETPELFPKFTPLILAAGLFFSILPLFWPFTTGRAKDPAVAKTEDVVKQDDMRSGGDKPFRDFQGVAFKAFSSSKLNNALSKDRGKYVIKDGDYRNSFLRSPYVPYGKEGCLVFLSSCEEKLVEYTLAFDNPSWPASLCNGVAKISVKNNAIRIYFNSGAVSEETVNFKDTLAFSRMMLESISKQQENIQKMAKSWE